jgi:hypothetical protein
MAEQTKGPLRGKPFVKGDPRAGRPKGVKNKSTIEIRDFAKRLIADKAYQKNLRVRLREGSAPHMETLLFHYAYGKPTETIDLGATAATALADLVKRATDSNG